MDERRLEHGLTWGQLAGEIDGCTAAMLSGLAKSRHVTIVRAMRVVIWLDLPAADFTMLRRLRTP